MEKQQIQTIGTYQILETIQDIPEWLLLKAVAQESEEFVLIKIYLPKLNWAEELLNEFFDRISYLKFIEHDNLLAILDFGKFQNTPYVVYPYYPFIFSPQGQPERFEPAGFLSKFHQIAEAMDYLHRQEIVHGLLGPETILVDAAGSPKLFDFGLSEVLKKVLFQNVENNFAFLSISNIKYTAPELLSGGNPTRQSDIYSYGLLFYFGIFGELPFEGKSTPETAIYHLQNDSTWAKQISGSISKGALALLKKCLAAQPAERFPSFQELLKALAQVKKTRLTARNFVRKAHPQPLPHNLPVSSTDDDQAKTTDELESPAPIKAKPRRSWVSALIPILLLAVAFATYYFLAPAAFPLSRSWQQTPTPTAGAAQPTATTPARISPTPTVLATSPAIEPATPTPEPALPTPTEALPPSTPEVAQPPQAIKPALEGEQATLPSEKISSANLNSLQEFSRLGYGRPEDADISSDFLHFAVATSTGVFIYNNNTYIKWIDPGGWATSVQFSPDGSLLAIGLSSGDIQVWDWQGEAMTYHLNTNGHSKKVNKMRFSKNGRYLYSASDDQDVIIWDVKSQNPLVRKIHAHAVPVEDIAISDDGSILVTGARDGVRVWNAASATRLWEPPYPGGANVLSVAISSDGEYVAAGGDDGKIFQWSLKQRQQRTDSLPAGKRVWGVRYISNDQTLFAALDDGKIKSFTASQEKYPGSPSSFSIPPVDPYLPKIFGADFRARSYSVPYSNGSGAVSIVWDGQVTSQGTTLAKPFYDSLTHLVFSQDGKVVAAQGKRGITSVWNLATNQVLYKDSAKLPAGQPIHPNNLAIAVIVPADGFSAGKGVDANEIYQWISLDGQSIKRTLSGVIPDGIVSFTKDGKLFTAGLANHARVWDFESSMETFFTTYLNSSGCQITKSINDGKTFQVNSAAGIILAQNEQTDQQTDNLCRVSRAQSQYLLAVSNGLNLLAYTKANGWLEAYDPATDKVLWPNKNYGALTALAISPDGSIIVAGNSQGTLTFINAQTGEALSTLTGNYGALQAITFTDDGKIMATTGADGAVRLFGIPSQK